MRFPFLSTLFIECYFHLSAVALQLPVNYTTPPTPPGFRVDVKFDDRHPMNPALIYGATITAADYWAPPSWDSIVRGGGQVRFNGRVAMYLADFSPASGSPLLRRGHLMLALHKLVFTVSERNLFFRPYVHVYLAGRLLATIALMSLPNEELALDSTNATIALEPDDSGLMQVVGVPWLRVRWQSINARRVPAADMFTSTMDAMVETATEPENFPRRYINAVSESGNCGFNVHKSSDGNPQRHELTNDILRTVLLLIMGEIFLRRRRFAELDFVILGDGVEMGQGFWMKISNDDTDKVNRTVIER
ncbi:MAG: hypothetical protein LQ350_006860 [Teloschistes chrysophthalmus]|nr:MAG: hypothetical protein LQ350_006860 [Niorma chrysophthalma]